MISARSFRCLLPGLVAVASGCGLWNVRCGEESRELSVRGEVREGDAQIAQATVVLFERRTTHPTQTFGWVISSELLTGHVDRIQLRDSGTGALYYDIIVTDSSGRFREFGETVAYAGTVSFAVLLDLLNAGKVRLHIATDLRGRELLTATLGSPERKGWSQPYCS